MFFSFDSLLKLPDRILKSGDATIDFVIKKMTIKKNADFFMIKILSEILIDYIYRFSLTFDTAISFREEKKV